MKLFLILSLLLCASTDAVAQSQAQPVSPTPDVVGMTFYCKVVGDGTQPKSSFGTFIYSTSDNTSVIKMEVATPSNGKELGITKEIRATWSVGSTGKSGTSFYYLNGVGERSSVEVKITNVVDSSGANASAKIKSNYDHKPAEPLKLKCSVDVRHPELIPDLFETEPSKPAA